jgi:hypothetical protein
VATSQGSTLPPILCAYAHLRCNRNRPVFQVARSIVTETFNSRGVGDAIDLVTVAHGFAALSQTLRDLTGVWERNNGSSPRLDSAALGC